MKTIKLAGVIFFLMILHGSANCQDCKVLGKTKVLKYEGGCTNGLANGSGTSYYYDSSFYTGKFESGVREGKGELHVKKADHTDSIVKGYWSGDEFQGKRYEPYVYNNDKILSDILFSFLGKKKKQLTIQIGLAKMGNPDESLLSATGQSLPRVIDMEVLESNNRVTQISKIEDALKAEYIYEISGFPVKLKMRLSNGNKMEFELNRSGEWLIEGYLYSKVEKRAEIRSRN